MPGPNAKIKREDAIALATGVAARSMLQALDAAEEKATPAATAVAAPPVESKKDEKSKDEGKDKDDKGDERDKAKDRDERRASRRPIHELGYDHDDDVRRRSAGVGRHAPVMPSSGPLYPSAYPDTGSDDQVDDPEVKKVLDAIPSDERARVIFRFRVKKPGKGGGGRVNNPVGEFHAVGDDWQQRIRDEIASTKGPGTYEGIPLTAEDGKPTGGAPWVFDVTEEQARAAGWTPDGEVKGEMTTGTATPKQRSVNEADQEKERIEFLKHKIESTKLELELAAIANGGKAPSTEDSGPKKNGEAMNEDVVRRLLEAEKARIKAEHEAELAKISAANEAKAAQAKLEAEREITKTRAEAAEQARKSEDAMRDLRNELGRKDTENAAKLTTLQSSLEGSFKDRERSITAAFEDKFNGLAKALERQEREREKERDRQPERGPEQTAAAIATAFAPLLNGLAPLGTALINKLTQPPPAPLPPPDPVAQMTAMTKVFTPLMEKLATPPPPPPAPPPPPPPVDPMAIVQQTVTMLKDAQPKQPTMRPEEIATQVAETVARTIAERLPHPTPVQPPAPAVDPMEFTTKVLGFAKQFSDMTARPAEVEREEPEDPLEQAEKTISRLKGLGVDIQIGGRPPAPETPQQSTVQEVFAGLRDTLPAFGKAVGEFVQSRGPQLDPKLIAEVQKKQLERKIAAKSKHGNRQPQRPQQPAQPQPQQPQQPQPGRAQSQIQNVPQRPAPRPMPTPTQAQQRPIQRPGQAVQRPQPAQPQQAPAQPQRQVAQPQPAQAQPAQAQQAPAQAQQANRFLTRQEQPYGLPVQYMTPPTPVPPAQFPSETIPQRAGPVRPQGFIPTETLPTAPPAAAPATKTPGVSMPPAPPPRQAQQAPAQQVAQPQQAPAQQVAQPQAAPAPVVAPTVEGPMEELAPDGANPTQKSWGSLATYLCSAISRLDDPDVVALALLERFPKSTQMIQAIGGSGGVDGLDMSLTSLASSAGAYAGVVGELASKIRSDPGKGWAARLIATLTGSATSA